MHDITVLIFTRFPKSTSVEGLQTETLRSRLAKYADAAVDIPHKVCK